MGNDSEGVHVTLTSSVDGEGSVKLKVKFERRLSERSGVSPGAAGTTDRSETPVMSGDSLNPAVKLYNKKLQAVAPTGCAGFPRSSCLNTGAGAAAWDSTPSEEKAATSGTREAAEEENRLDGKSEINIVTSNCICAFVDDFVLGEA